MLHKFLTPGPWFAAKRFGIGAGRPIAWQGWVLLASYLGVLAGLGRLARQAQSGAITLTALALCTGLLLLVVHKRTEGGWKWHWGRK